MRLILHFNKFALLAIFAVWLFYLGSLAPLRAQAFLRYSYHLPFEPAVGEFIASGALLSSVKLYFLRQKMPAKTFIVRRNLGVRNYVDAPEKSIKMRCIEAMQAALRALQDAALKYGANAVVNISSHDPNSIYPVPTYYECYVDTQTSITTVTLRADFAII